MKLLDQVHEACLTKHYSTRNGALSEMSPEFSEFGSAFSWLYSPVVVKIGILSPELLILLPLDDTMNPADDNDEIAMRKKNLSRSVDEKSWYLKDSALENLEEEDAFQHKIYVNHLVDTLRELEPPFTLGIFGSWGIGKTTIANDLVKTLRGVTRSADTATANIDVWKYEGDSLRRQFLWDLQEQLKQQKVLKSGYDEVKEVYEEKGLEWESQRCDLGRLKKMAIPLIGASVFTFFTYLFFLKSGITSPLQALIPAVIVPIIMYLFSEFSRNTVVNERHMITRPIFFSADQFERKFKKIVKDANCEKLVIVVDNLDRCSHERVVQTLGTIKTFLEPRGQKKCIFVIPCDDHAIKQHVEAAYKVLTKGEEVHLFKDYAEEYLRKFFNASIRIDRFLPEEIEPYIAEQLEKAKISVSLGEEGKAELVQMIGFAFGENPRRIKQYLNNLASKYLLARGREAGSNPQIKPPITDNILFFAKVAAIECRFPLAFEHFLEDDNLYNEVISALQPGKKGDDRVARLLDTTGDLERFLVTTRRVTAANPKAFFHLKQSPHESAIPDYSQFAVAIRQGQYESVIEAYQAGKSEENIARTDEILRQIRDYRKYGYINYALNAITVAGKICQRIDETRLAQGVAEVMATTEQILKELYQLDPRPVVAMLKHAESSDREAIRGAYLGLFGNAPEDIEKSGIDWEMAQERIAEALVPELSDMREREKRQFRSAISKQKPLGRLLHILTSTKEARAALIEASTLENLVNNIAVEEVSAFAQREAGVQEHFRDIETLIRCSDLHSSDVAPSWVAKLLELLNAAMGKSNGLFSYAVQCVTDTASILRDGPETEVSNIARLMRSMYSRANDEVKFVICQGLWQLQDAVSANERRDLVSLVKNEFFVRSPAIQVKQFLALHRTPEYSGGHWGSLLQQFAQRLVGGAAGGLAQEFAEIASDLLKYDPGLLTELFVELMRRPELETSLSLVRKVIPLLPGGSRGKHIVAPLLNETLVRSDHRWQPANQRHLLELVLELRKWHTKDFQRALADHFVKLLTDSLVNRREIGIETLESFAEKGIIPPPQHRDILREVANYWMVQSPSRPLDASQRKLVSLIIDKRELSLPNAEEKLKVVRWLVSRLRPQFPAEERQYIANLIPALQGLAIETLEEIVPQCVGYAEATAEKDVRLALHHSLISLFSKNNPLERDVWSDLYEYVRKLLASGKNQDNELGKEMRKAMSRIVRHVRKSLSTE